MKRHQLYNVAVLAVTAFTVFPAINCQDRIVAGSRIPIDVIPATPGPKAKGSVYNQSIHVQTYPDCKLMQVDSVDDKDYMIKQLQAAPTLRKPFDAATYFCGLLPTHLYHDVIQSFPPDTEFENYESKKKNCGEGGCRYSLSAFSLVKQKTAPNWRKFSKAKQVFKDILDIVFSHEFETALWKKLGITAKPKRREMRILSDKHGFSNGRIHTDMQARKVATMMFYLPVTDKTAFDYGTCLHTTSQWKNRQIMKQHGVKRPDTGMDGEGDCYFKFRFLPNTGYSFKVGTSSWHSAPNFFIKHHDEYDRNTILFNWY